MNQMLLSEAQIDKICQDFTKQLEEQKSGRFQFMSELKNHTAWAIIDIEVDVKPCERNQTGGGVQLTDSYNSYSFKLVDFWINDENEEEVTFREPIEIKQHIQNRL